MPAMLRRLLLCLAFVCAVPANAQDREVPYWASLRVDEVNMRVGPSESYPVDWVYKRKHLPVKVVRLMQGWRLVRDRDGPQGWVVGGLLRPERSAIVGGEGLGPMRARPGAASTLLWNAEPGVVGILGGCGEGWCRRDVEGRRGWVEQDRLWGAGE